MNYFVTVFWYKNLFSVETYCIHYNIIPIVESYGFIQISSHGTVQQLRITYLISGVRGEKRSRTNSMQMARDKCSNLTIWAQVIWANKHFGQFSSPYPICNWHTDKI